MSRTGLDCGFNASDLLLVYFFDQNSDACERLFTIHIADLLDEYIPGSNCTSLYIRAVYHLIQPFRVPDFGSPKDVQKSVFLCHNDITFVEESPGTKKV